MQSEQEIKEARERLKQVVANIEQIDARARREMELLDIPFMERLKQDKEVFDRVKKNQENTFKNYSAKKWDLPKDKINELFIEYWEAFLAEECKNIATFLESRGYSFPEERRGVLQIG